MCLRLAIAYMSGYESYPLIFMWSEEVTMGLLELFLLAIGLSMDAFAVSVCKGLAMQKVNFRSAAICGVWFGGFQALMPTIGFFLGALFADAIEGAKKAGYVNDGDLVVITAGVPLGVSGTTNLLKVDIVGEKHSV